MPAHLKQRRVIFPVLHADDFPSPRSTVDCIAEISPEVEKDMSTTCNLTLKDVALSQASNVDFKNSHMLPLSPLLSRERLARFGLDWPSRFVPALPFAPRIEVTKGPAMLQSTKEQSGDDTEGSVPLGSVRTYSRRAMQPTSSSGGRRSILPVRVSPMRSLSSSIGSDSFNSDISSVRSECEPVLESPNTVKKYPSILRSSSYAKRSVEVEKVSSVESDIPSLASSDTSDTQSPASEHNRRPNINLKAARDVIFNARVLVREFCRSEEEASCIWYTAAEMSSFKMDATKRIMAFTRTEIIPTGTGRMIERPITPTATKALFSHAALQADSLDVPFPAFDSICGMCPPEANNVAIKRILIVDPYDICLKLFAKAFQQAIPGAIICTSRTSEEALKQVCKTTFDLIVVEERLKLFHRQQPGGNADASGSLLLQRIATMTKNRSVLVGVSAHLPEDAKRLQEVGQADLLWAKPPPPLSRELLMQLGGLMESKRAREKEDTDCC